MQVAVGTYVGNGSDGHAVTGVGFAPVAVFVKSGSTTADTVLALSSMPAGQSALVSTSAALETDCVKSLDAGGFTVGTDTRVNQNGTTYHYLALGDNDNADLHVGSYTGNGIDNTSISGCGFQPDFVLVRSIGAYGGVWRTSDVAGDLTATFTPNSDFANGIQAMEADGFQIGSGAVYNTNKSGLDYAYLAIKKSALTAGGTYTGNGTDDRDITGVGFQPDAVWVKRQGTSAAVSRPSTESGDNTHYIQATAKAANLIQALATDGFQVGNGAVVNSSGSGYRWWAWKAGIAGNVEVAVSDSIALSDAIGDRQFGAADAVSLAEAASVALSKAQDDGIALSESVGIALGLSVADGIALSESVVIDQGRLISRLELQATITNKLRSRLQMRCEIFRDRLQSRLALQCTISPRVRGRLTLQATVINQALEAAAAADVIAPTAEISFL
jgi:hypothetical protein